MNFRTVDEFENFDFNEAHIGGIEVKSGHVFLYLDNVMISAKNSCNRDIREMRTNELVLKLQDGQITSFVKEGVKVYNADGVFQREIPDEIIPAEKYQETFEMLFDKYMIEAGIKKNDETAENIYEFEIEYEEFSYLLVVKAAHDVEEWDKFMNK